MTPAYSIALAGTADGGDANLAVLGLERLGDRVHALAPQVIGRQQLDELVVDVQVHGGFGLALEIDRLIGFGEIVFGNTSDEAEGQEVVLQRKQWREAVEVVAAIVSNGTRTTNNLKTVRVHDLLMVTAIGEAVVGMIDEEA